MIPASVADLEKSSAVIDHLTTGGAPRSKGVARAEFPGAVLQAAWTAIATATDCVACAMTKNKAEGVARSGQFSDHSPPRHDQNDPGKDI
jgi:hypothetical protein